MTKSLVDLVQAANITEEARDTQDWVFREWTSFPDWKPIEPALIQGFCAEVARRIDVDFIGWGWAVPHASHIPGFAKPGSRLRERASLADGKTFLHTSCCCKATPVELAVDIGFPASWLHPLASGEQTLMFKIQRRLREDLHDPVARELLALKGISVQQALLWRISDTGWPVELWNWDAEVARGT